MSCPPFHYPVNPGADPRVKAVLDDIRATRKTDFINNLWLYLAFDPDLLDETWRDVKSVMATPSALDPLSTLIYSKSFHWRAERTTC